MGSGHEDRSVVGRNGLGVSLNLDLRGKVSEDASKNVALGLFSRRSRGTGGLFKRSDSHCEILYVKFCLYVESLR